MENNKLNEKELLKGIIKRNGKWYGIIKWSRIRIIKWW